MRSAPGGVQFLRRARYRLMDFPADWVSRTGRVIFSREFAPRRIAPLGVCEVCWVNADEQPAACGLCVWCGRCERDCDGREYPPDWLEAHHYRFTPL